MIAWKTALFSIVSHELRTPLTSIKGYVENMLDGLSGSLTEKHHLYLCRVKENADRLTRRLNETFHKLKRGSSNYTFSVFR